MLHGVVIGKIQRAFNYRINQFEFQLFSKSLAPKYDELAKKLKNENGITM